MPESVEVVVRETGSPWPEWLNRAPATDRIVMSADDEAESELSSRVQRLTERLAREGRRVRRAVVLVGVAPDNQLFDSRRRFARALIHQMDPGPGSELVFVARPTPEVQQKLIVLMGALGDLLKGTRIDVSLRFCQPAA